jgi:hypothetical protein
VDSGAAVGAIESSMTHLTGHDRRQTLLLPEMVDDYVGADNPVRFIDAFVDGLDLAAAGFARVAPEAVNAGEKMHRRAGVKMHHGRALVQAASPPTQLSSSIDGACFPVPTWHHVGHGAQRRGWEERSHAQHREHGEHRTFPVVSTVAG